MTEISRNQRGQIVRKVFEILMSTPNGLLGREVIEEVSKSLNLTDGEIVKSSTISFVKAGWLIKNKGIWKITNAGKLAYETIDDPEKFVTEAEDNAIERSALSEKKKYSSVKEGLSEDDVGAALLGGIVIVGLGAAALYGIKKLFSNDKEEDNKIEEEIKARRSQVTTDRITFQPREEYITST